MRPLAYFLSNHGKQLRYKVMPFLNLFLVVISVALNHHFNGGFCVFVVWAAVVQVLSFLNIILFTWLERTPLCRPNALICGISTGVFLYWLCFTFPDNIILPIPQWFLFVLIWCNLVHPVNKKVRLWYAAGLAVCAVFVLWSGLTFRLAANGVRSGEYDKHNPMTERILGMHFRYHTRACPFDGWRPPLHDPAMVIGMRLNGDRDPLAPICLEDRLILYHTVFPDRPVMARCACSVESEQYGYFTDNLWKTLSFPPAPKIKKESLGNGQAVEIYYLDRDVRDTVRIRAVE